MTKPKAVWRLRKSFRELTVMDTAGHLNAWGDRTEGGRTWYLSGINDDLLKFKFTKLAEQGAALDGYPKSEGALDYWLNRVSDEACFSRVVFGCEGEPDGVITANEGKLIRGVCRASLDFCESLIASASFSSKASGPARVSNHEDVAKNVSTSSNRVLIQAFLDGCKQAGFSNVTRKHIWTAVGHRSPRQFEHWQSGKKKIGRNPGYSNADDENFRRVVVNTRPEEFWREALSKSPSKLK